MKYFKPLGLFFPPHNPSFQKNYLRLCFTLGCCILQNSFAREEHSSGCIRQNPKPPAYFRPHYIVLKMNAATVISTDNYKMAAVIKPVEVQAAYEEIFFNKEVYYTLKYVSQGK